MPTDSEHLDFGADSAQEHANILKAKARSSDAIWELGARLLRFKLLFGWQKLEGEGTPYKDWTDYLTRGVGVSMATALKYMDAAVFPRALVLELGPEKSCWLKRCTDLTTVDEAPEQALALELPVASGGTKPVKAMTAEEVEEAYRLMRDADRQAKRPLQPAQAKPTEAGQLEQTAEAAVRRWLSPGNVRARRRADKVLLDVTGVPKESAADVFSALAAALRD